MTADPDIPGDVQVFLRNHIESYEELEMLLLVRRLRGQWHSLPALTAQLPLPGIGDETAEALVARRLLATRRTSPETLYSYAPADPALELVVARLAQTYAMVPLAVMKLMTANALDRLRASALQTFADAFVLGRRRRRDG